MKAETRLAFEGGVMVDVEVRAMEILKLRCILPRMWKPRLWLAARIFWLGALLTGMSCEIEISSK